MKIRVDGLRTVAWEFEDTHSGSERYGRIMSISWNAETLILSIGYTDTSQDPTGTRVFSKYFQPNEYTKVVIEP